MRKIIMAVMISILLLTMVMSTPVVAAPVTWHVYDSNGMTVQQAVEAASPGDTIIVHKGTYNYDEPVSIHKDNITLTGEGGPMLYGPGYVIGDDKQPEGPEAIFISPDANGVTIEGFEFCNYRSAIIIIDSTGNLIQRNVLSDNGDGSHSFYDGINLANAHNNQVLDNEITDCEVDGIWVGPDDSGQGSTGNLVSGNEISGCHGGIILDHSDGNRIMDNTVKDSTGIGPEQGPGIFVGHESNHNTVSGNSISGCNDGINLGNAEDNWILENTIKGSSSAGIGLGPDGTGLVPSDNHVIGNTISDGNNGICLMNAHVNEILENEIRGSTKVGILLADGSTLNPITGNNVSGCGTGILLFNANNNTVQENKVTGSKEIGIGAGGNPGSKGNLIKENRVSGSRIYDLFQNPLSNNTWDENKYRTSNF